MYRRKLTVFVLVLLSLISAVIVPVFATGYNDLNAAQAAIKREDYSSAMQSYESAAQLFFWRNDLWEQAGLAAYHGGSQSKAIQLLALAHEKRALSEVGFEILGSLYWTTGNRSGAFAVWQDGLKHHPTSKSIIDHLSSAYDQVGDYASEEPLLIKRLELAPTAAAYYRLALIMSLSNPQDAPKEFLNASSVDVSYEPASKTMVTTLNIAAIEPDPARRLVIIGRGLGLVEEWGLASNAFKHAVLTDAGNSEAWAWLGEAYQHTGLGGKAELDKAISLDPNDALVRGLRGLYWKRQGEYKQALDDYLQAMKNEPANPAWVAAAGESYAWTGDLVSALASYKTATSLAPNDATYWRLLALFCADHGVDVLALGLPAAKMAAQLQPEDAQVLDALGWSYLNAGYLFNAEQTLLKAIQASPNLALTHLHLAELYLRKGDNNSALNELNRVRDLDENGPSGQLASQLLKQYFP